MEITFTEVDIPTRPKRVRTGRTRTVEARPVKDLAAVEHLCPNCESYFRPSAPSRLYCGIQCQAEATYVRYARRKYAEYPEGDLPEDIVEAIQMQRAHALGGGYDKEARRLPQDVRAFVIARDSGLCVVCAEPGTEIDHIDGDSGDPTNLRLLCHDCHMEITRARFVPVTDEKTKRRAEMLFVRVESPEPLFECDVDNWRTLWRAFIRDSARPI